VVKPVSGTLDLATKTLEGIRNTTTMFDPTQRGRVRHTRFIGMDGVLLPYSPETAMGNEWLMQLGLVEPREDYRLHGVLRISTQLKKPNVFLVTSHRIILLTVNKKNTAFDAEWKEQLADVSAIQLDERKPQDPALLVQVLRKTSKIFGKKYEVREARVAPENIEVARRLAAEVHTLLTLPKK